MISRHYKVGELMATMEPYVSELKGFYPEEWLAYPDNVCLTDGNGNFTLFERSSPRAVTGHYFLKARGRDALKLCKEFLKEIFTGPYDVEVIIGITPIDKKGALWMNNQLGFIKKEIIDTIVGRCQLVVLTKREWEKNNE